MDAWLVVGAVVGGMIAAHIAIMTCIAAIELWARSRRMTGGKDGRPH